MHSIVLAAASEYFYNIFSNDTTSHHLNFVGSETLDKIIRFCYTGEMDLSSESIGHIVNVAHELQMHQLKSVCNQFLETTSNSENCLQYALIAERFGLKSSKELAKKMLAENCHKICRSNELQSRDAKQIDDVIENLCKNQCETFEMLINSLDSGDGENNSLLLYLHQAIYRSFVRFFFQFTGNTTTIKIFVQSISNIFNHQVRCRLHSINDEYAEKSSSLYSTKHGQDRPNSGVS